MFLKGEMVGIHIKDVVLDRSGPVTNPWENESSRKLMPVYNYVPVLNIIRETADLANAYYPFEEVDVNIWHGRGGYNALDIPCNGSADPEGIYLAFYSEHPRYPNPNTLYKEVTRSLPLVVSHELGHLARMREGFNPDTILDWAVHEVVALHFQKTLVPGDLLDLDPNEEHMQFLEERIKQQRDLPFRHESLGEWKFGDKGFPIRGMYILAKAWRDRLMEKSEGVVEPEELFQIPSKDLIAQIAPQAL